MTIYKNSDLSSINIIKITIIYVTYATHREVRLIQSNLSDISDKFNMELDTNPTKPTKCVRLIKESNISVVRFTESCCTYILYIYILIGYLKLNKIQILRNSFKPVSYFF